MAKQSDSFGGSSDSVAVSERTKKAAATRAITAEKLAKLAGNQRYAFKQATSLRQSAEALADHILNGGDITPETLNVCKMAEAQIGQSLFT